MSLPQKTRILVQIIFAVPGIVLATVFVTFPFVARELIPDYNVVAAFAMASLLALLGVVTLAAKTFLEHKVQQELQSPLEPSSAEESS